MIYGHRVHALGPAARPLPHAHHADARENGRPGGRLYREGQREADRDVPRHARAAKRRGRPVRTSDSASCKRRASPRSVHIILTRGCKRPFAPSRAHPASTAGANGARGARRSACGRRPASWASPNRIGGGWGMHPVKRRGLPMPRARRVRARTLRPCC